MGNVYCLTRVELHSSQRLGMSFFKEGIWAGIYGWKKTPMIHPAMSEQTQYLETKYLISKTSVKSCVYWSQLFL